MTSPLAAGVLLLVLAPGATPTAHRHPLVTDLHLRRVTGLQLRHPSSDRVRLDRLLHLLDVAQPVRLHPRSCLDIRQSEVGRQHLSR